MDDVTHVRRFGSAGSTSGTVAGMRSSSMGVVNCCQGLQTAVCYKATQIRRRVNFCSKRSFSSGLGQGDCVVIKQTRNQSSPERGKSSGFLFPLLPHSKEGRLIPEAHFRPPYVKQTLTEIQVQNADTQSALQFDPSKRLVRDERFSRRVFSHCHLSSTQEISQVCLSRSSLRVPDNPIRSFFSSEGVQQVCGGSAVSIKEQQHQNIFIHRRLSHMLPLTGAGGQRFCYGVKSPQGPRVQYKRGKESPGAGTEYGVPGAQDKLPHLPRQAVRGEGDGFQTVSHTFSTRESGDIQTVPPTSRTHGVGYICGAIRAAYDEGFSEMDGVSAPLLSASSVPQSENNGALCRGSPGVERPGSADVRRTSGNGVVQGNHDNGRFPVGMGRDAVGQNGQWHVVPTDGSAPHKCVGNAGSVFSTQAFFASSTGASCVGENRQHHCGSLYQPSGGHSLSAAAQAGSEDNCVGQYTVPVPPSDPCSRDSEQGSGHIVQGEPTVQGVEASPTGGATDLAEIRPGRRRSLRLSRRHSLPTVLLPVRCERTARRGRSGPPLAECPSLCFSATQPDLSDSGQSAGAEAVTNFGCSSVAIQTLDSRDNAASGGRAMAAPHTQGSSFPGAGRDFSSSPRPPLSVGLARERWNLNAAGLPPEVVDTIQNARASSTRSLYSGKWRVFEEWCNNRGTIPFQCSVAEVLCFLQELLDKGRAFSTIKVYLAAISACHVGFGEKSAGQHPLVCRFMKGARRKLPVSRPLVPLWDLLLVLDALSHHPFEPIEVVGLRFLSVKTALLLSLTTAKRVSDLQALSVHPSCLQLAPGRAKACFRPNPAFVPKVMEPSYRCPTLELLAFHPPPFSSEEDERLHTLCPVRALGVYVDRTAGFRRTNQLFVSWATPHKGRPLSCQRLSHWIVEAISIAYRCKGSQPPLGVRAHSTRSMASSWALFRGVSVQDICTAASWATPHTFVRFYRLDVVHPSLSHAVLEAGTDGLA
ncbi:uncharacterized protein LOC115426842 [Sphaeramia orbicularis]|uniref:uncharacterized protein LOC115426842 n=1 Tax=Sphaeramia orbicularis TaxID=375764 RepID=UPI00117CA940|nr:uncharacterized protein LOC115426842 [Sphaeramia orbicularis]